MRKVAAGLFSSIDGVVEAPNEWQPSTEVRRLHHPRFCGSVVERHTDEGLSGRVRCGIAPAGRRDDRHGGQPVAGPVADRPGLLDELTLMISPVVAGSGRNRLSPGTPC